jgi:hypothetical protein
MDSSPKGGDKRVEEEKGSVESERNRKQLEVDDDGTLEPQLGIVSSLLCLYCLLYSHLFLSIYIF